MRYLTLTLIFAWVGLAGPADAQDLDWTRIDAEYKRAVVFIRVTGVLANGQDQTRRGTGVLVSNNRVLTAGHVVGKDTEWSIERGLPKRRIEVEILQPSGVRGPPVQASASTLDAADMAVLKLAARADDCAPLSPNSLPDEPGSFVIITWGRDKTQPDAFPVSTLARAVEDGDRATLNFKSTNGDSGAPIFNGNGVVVGILRGEGQDRADTSIIEPSFLAERLLPQDAVCNRSFDGAELGSPSYNGISVKYFAKNADQRKVVNALRANGIAFSTEASSLRNAQDFESNAVACGPDVPADVIRHLAVTLLEGGVALRSIQRHEKPATKPKRLDIITQLDDDFTSELKSPILTKQQIMELQGCPNVELGGNPGRPIQVQNRCKEDITISFVYQNSAYRWSDPQQESNISPGKTRQLRDNFDRLILARREFYLYATGTDGRVILQGDANAKKDKMFQIADETSVPFKYYLFDGQPRAFSITIACDTASRE